MSILATCDEGCGKQFTIKEMPVTKLGDGIEKTSFACEHCQHEYVAFYTDEEIRKLQVRLRRIHRRFEDPNANHDDADKKSKEMAALIREKMDALRERVEGV